MAGSNNFDEYRNRVVEKLRQDMEARNRQDQLLAGKGALYKAKGVLTVDKVDFCAKQNAKEHRTDRYELVQRTPPEMVTRRCQPFSIIIRFQGNRTFDPARDKLTLVFNYGPKPNVSTHTQGVLEVTGADEFTKDKYEGDVLLYSKDESSVHLKVQIPNDVPVGIWKCQIRTGLVDDPVTLKVYDCPDDLYVLFNPWCPGDSTYMEDTNLLNEYVLADVGKIWLGPASNPHSRQWVFGQYDHAALPVAIYLLEQSQMPHASRCNPVLVSRALTKMVNSNDDDDGVVEGSWSGDYSDGVSPHAWTGSVKILEEYLLTRKPVRYGQCFVMAGVLTTVCRALGLPARAVTNLISGHDTNGTLTIDRYYNCEGYEMECGPDGSHDSVWNYHVWVEAWMARPDLPKGYGGWQAIDATPQEKSGGFFQCGPASVEAVRNGQVGLAYDVPYLLGAVNADYVRWKEDKSSLIGFVKIDCDRRKIGRSILTKKPNVFDHEGDTDAEDITLNYKSAEGTQEERLMLLNAVRASSRATPIFHVPTGAGEDVVFTLVKLERVPVGEPFAVVIKAQNNSASVRTVDIVLTALSLYYTGNKASTVKKATGKFVLEANTSDSLKLVVQPDEYMEKLVDTGIMKMTAMVTVKETKQSWADEDDFQIVTPNLDVKVNGSPIVGRVLEVTASFTNPLNVPLTGCKLNYEGPGLSRPSSIDTADVPAKGDISVTVPIIPRFAGEHRLVLAFDSKELVDVTGSVVINVTKA